MRSRIEIENGEESDVGRGASDRTFADYIRHHMFAPLTLGSKGSSYRAYVCDNLPHAPTRFGHVGTTSLERASFYDDGDGTESGTSDMHAHGFHRAANVETDDIRKFLVVRISSTTPQHTCKTHMKVVRAESANK